MKTINGVAQGSPEWLEIRGKYRPSSEAPIIMGCGRISREELLRMKSTGDRQEFSKWTQEVLFERGHEIEAMARPLAEKVIGEDLFPVTGVCDDGYLLASFDGLTMLEDTVWECKSWNQSKVASVAEDTIPEVDFWQVVHQLAVSGAERALYTVSDGTPENTVHCWLRAADAQVQIAGLLAAWKQFDADLSAHVPQQTVAEVVGREPDQLPALVVEVTGMVKSSNLKAFQDHALDVLRNINRSLNTDEDFANAAKTVAWCDRVEKALEAKKADIIGQMSTIEEVSRVIDSLKAETRTVRLELDKLVEARKKSIRAEIANEAVDAFRKHLEDVNAGLPSWATISASEISADFGAAMKGKKNITSLRDATSQALANAKIDIGKIATVIQANLLSIAALQDDYIATGNRDLPALIRQAHCKDVVEARITTWKAEQQRKEDEQRARIRAEEESRAQREKDAAIDAERKRLQAEADEAARITREEERKRNTAAMVKGQKATTPQPPAPEPTQPATFETDLARWADAYGVSDYALDQLYVILHKHNVSLEAA